MSTRTDYFAGCATREQVKARYRELAMANHPDRRPPEERPAATVLMQEINRQYALANDRLAREEKPGQSEEFYQKDAAIAEEIRLAILRIINIPHITIEICGLWVWVKGDTKPHRQQLKAAGYRWAPKKAMWYFAGIPSSGRGQTMEHIRSRYGSTIIKEDEP